MSSHPARGLGFHSVGLQLQPAFRLGRFRILKSNFEILPSAISGSGHFNIPDYRLLRLRRQARAFIRHCSLLGLTKGRSFAPCAMCSVSSRLIPFPGTEVIADNWGIDSAMNGAYSSMQAFICMPPLVLRIRRWTPTASRWMAKCQVHSLAGYAGKSRAVKGN